MIASKLFPKNKLNPSGRTTIDLEEVDRVLGVPAAKFAAAARKLAKQLSKHRVGVNVAGYRDRRSVTLGPNHPLPTNEARGGFYQVELRRLPPMDRDEEFLMARRYEFMKLRVQLALQATGMGAAAATTLASRQRSELLRTVGTPSPWLEACSRELEDLRNLYVEGALHIVLGIVARYRGLGVDSPDLIQEGNASLFQAIEGFDWRREVRFRTYAQYWVQQAVLKALYNSARTVRIPIWVQKLLGRVRRLQDEARRTGRDITNAEIAERLGVSEQKIARVLATKRYALSLDAQVGDDGGSMAQMLPDESLAAVPDQVREGDLRHSLDEAMVDLPDRERMILQRRFGLGGVEPETLGDIASDLGITAERVRQLQNAALNRLQQPVKKRRLAAFVESV